MYVASLPNYYANPNHVKNNKGVNKINNIIRHNGNNIWKTLGTKNLRDSSYFVIAYIIN